MSRRFSAAIELREYQLKPSDATTFLKKSNDAAELRKQLAPLRLFATTDTGGQLNTALHLYYYSSLQQRDDARRVMRENAEWNRYAEDCSRRCCDKQSSSIFAEAAFVAETFGGMATHCIPSSDDDSGIYELRRYQLILGYDTVPKFIDYYSSALGSKLEASKDAGSRFCSLLYTEVGSLNEVIELWRHNGISGMQMSRVLSRQSQPWKTAIGNIAPLALSFTNTLLKPAPFSNWR